MDAPSAAAREDKAALRRRMRALRRGLAAPPTGPAAARSLVNSLLAAPDPLARTLIPPPGARVAGYLPIGGELDVHPLMAALAERGCPLALPVVTGPTAPLVFRAWRPGDPLEDGPFGTRQPPAAAPLVHPAWILVPLLAFDRRGYRLGQGGGFYDRTLAAADQDPPVALGLAFAAQAVEALPIEPHDRPLAAVATEAGLILCDPGGTSAPPSTSQEGPPT